VIDKAFGLIGDIGATHARFALTNDRGGQTQLRTFATDKYPGIFQAVSAYLSVADISKPPKKAVVAVAAAVTGDQVKMTNHPWEFSIEGLRAQLGFERLSVINDFAANALAMGDLAEGDLEQIGGSQPVSNVPIGVIGPGSGLGMSALLFAGDRAIPIPSEGCEQAHQQLKEELGLDHFEGRAAILGFIATAWRLDRVAAWLFVPYAARVAFASVLNGSIWMLN
jgi:glucokinase